MNIDEMPAGRDIDVLVAYKVMGWTEISGAVGRVFGIPPKEEGSALYDIVIGFGKKAPIPRYSTDIAAAWDVTTQIPASFFLEHPLTVGDCWCAKFEDRGEAWHDEVLVYATTSTAPLAICRAALKFTGCMERMYGENVWRANEHRRDASGL